MNSIRRSIQNWRVFRRNGEILTFIDTSLAASPESAAEDVAGVPGKYVVTDLNFTEVHQVYVRLRAEAI